MTAEDVTLSATKALCPLRNHVDNYCWCEEFFLASLFEKYCSGQSSLEQVRKLQLSAAAFLEGEIKMWLKMIHRCLSPRMKARNAWTVEFKWAMLPEVFNLILQALKMAHSAYGVSYRENKHVDNISYVHENRLLKDFSQLSHLSCDSVRGFLSKKSKGSRKGNLEFVINFDAPLAISFVKKTQEVVVKVHYRFTN